MSKTVVWISTLVWYVFQKHGWMMTLCLPPDFYMNCLIIKAFIKLENYSKGDGVSIYRNKSSNFKLRPNLNINSWDVESEILFYKEQNTSINVLYRPPKGFIEPFEIFSKEIKKKKKNTIWNLSILLVI